MNTLFVAAMHTANSDARTGIQMVVRGLLRGLREKTVDFRAVQWSNGSLLPLSLKQAANLGMDHHVEGSDLPAGSLEPRTGWESWLTFRRKTRTKPRLRPFRRKQLRGSWILLPEVLHGSKELQVIRYARNHKMHIAAIFHDAIAVNHPELVRYEAREFHPAYMVTLCDVDLLIAVSSTAAEQFRLFAEKESLRLPPIYVCHSAGECFDGPHASVQRDVLPDVVNILCVSTLEPRKNHKTLLQAFELASSAVSNQKLYLHLVGDRYKDAEYIVDLIKAATARNPSVLWHGKVSDRQLIDFYGECDFTIFPSFIEGFGLPIAQSLWYRRPCICADFGAMAEIAKGGGCLTVDVRDPVKLGNAITALATRPDLRRKLVEEAESRHVKSWREYATEICGTLAAALDHQSTVDQPTKSSESRAPLVAASL